MITSLLQKNRQLLILPQYQLLKNILILVALTLINIATFLPSLSNDFTNWDDPKYVLNNPLIKDFSLIGVGHVFSKFLIGDQHYHPLTTLSWAFDYHMAGFNPWQFHIHNLILHIFNTLLVFGLILIWNPSTIIAFSSAFIFAVHPMHVESIAWITERKDLLYSFFYLLALITYSKYSKSKSTENKKGYSFLLLTYFLFTCSLLSKPAAITFPITMFLIDYYYSRILFFNTRNAVEKNIVILIEKIPFLILALLSVWLAQKQYLLMGGYQQTIYPIGDRILMASYTFIIYLKKFIWPSDLCNYYPVPEKINGTLPNIFHYAAVLSLAIIGILTFVSKNSRIAKFGILFFIVTIFPVLGFVPFGPYLMAERYTYIPYIGLIFISTNIVFHNLKKFTHQSIQTKIIFFSTLTILALFFMNYSYHRSLVWKNSETLWTDAINKYPQAALPYHNRAIYRMNEKQWNEALQDFSTALRINPNYYLAYINRGLSYIILGRAEDAINDFSNAIILAKTSEGFKNRAQIYQEIRKYDLAIADYTEAIKLNSFDPKLYLERSNLYLLLNEYSKAYSDMSKIYKDFQNDPEFLSNYGATCQMLNKYDEALNVFNAALIISPQHSRTYYNRGILYKTTGQFKLANMDFIKAKELGYKY